MRRVLLQSCSPTCARALLTSALCARPSLQISPRHLSSNLGKEENKTRAASLGIQGFSGFKSAEKALEYQSFRPKLDSEMTDLLKAHSMDINQANLKLSKMLLIDPVSERFVGEGSEQANRFLKREYRAPFVVPEQV